MVCWWFIFNSKQRLEVSKKVSHRDRISKGHTVRGEFLKSGFPNRFIFWHFIVTLGRDQPSAAAPSPSALYTRCNEANVMEATETH